MIRLLPRSVISTRLDTQIWRNDQTYIILGSSLLGHWQRWSFTICRYDQSWDYFSCESNNRAAKLITFFVYTFLASGVGCFWVVFAGSPDSNFVTSIGQGIIRHSLDYVPLCTVDWTSTAAPSSFTLNLAVCVWCTYNQISRVI